MTRTTDDLHPEPFGGLGEKVVRKPSPDLQPEWRPRPGSPGIEENRQGQVRTTDLPQTIVPPKRFP